MSGSTISRFDFDATGLENCEVWSGRPKPAVDFHTGGNHECAAINRIYGFYDECKRAYGLKVWKQFNDVFNCLPVAAIVDDKIFCVHGGLSPSLRSKQQITEHRRPCDVPDVGLICDFLWADPDACTQGWAESERGVSYTFGSDVVSKFLEDHDFDLMVRASACR